MHTSQPRWVQTLPIGLYRVYWVGGGSSLAAVGMCADGRRWLAPTNWLFPSADVSVWESVGHVQHVIEHE